ncbi:MAG: beta-glycosidase [Dysgonamonadaceae bacterium]|jgi:hypothetical protein|nr:beta-glycosidase [Dysgonamonadaceae bacterium]
MIYKLLIITCVLIFPCTLQPQSLRVRINPAETRQEIEYFTASDAWSGNFVGMYWDNKEKERIAKYLFSQKTDETGAPEGIGLSLWRVNLGAGTLEQDSADILPPHRRAESFLTKDGNCYDRGKCSGQQYFMQKAAEYGCNNFLLFSNSPPVQYTQNGKGWSSSLHNANIQPDAYGKFASYLADAADYFVNTKRWNISFISPINEPQVEWTSPRQEGTPWANSEMKKMFVALDEALSNKGLNDVKMLLGESADLSALYEKSEKLRQRFPAGEAPDMQIKTFFDPAGPHYIGNLKHLPKLIAGHSYHSHATNQQLKTTREKLKTAADKYGIDFHQSEWCMLPGINKAMDGFLPGWECDNYAGMDVALLLGRLIYGDMVYANAKSWGYWKAMEINGNHALISLFPKNGNLSGGGAVRTNKLLWALGNYSFFIRPGYTRIALEGADDLNTVVGSAYLSPEKLRIVIVFVNSSFDNISVKTILPGNDAKKIKKATVFCTNEHTDLANIRNMKNMNTDITLTPRSIITLVLDLAPDAF